MNLYALLCYTSSPQPASVYEYYIEASFLLSLRVNAENGMSLGLHVFSLAPCRRAFRIYRHLKTTSVSTTRNLHFHASQGLLKRMSQDPVVVSKVDLPVDEARYADAIAIL